MKMLARIVGICGLLLGLVMILVSNKAAEDMALNRVSFGYVIDGEVIMTDKGGYIGGNVEGVQDAESAGVAGGVVTVLGGVALLGSFLFKE